MKKTPSWPSRGHTRRATNSEGAAITVEGWSVTRATCTIERGFSYPRLVIFIKRHGPPGESR
jgi:hypothetical protein